MCELQDKIHGMLSPSSSVTGREGGGGEAKMMTTNMLICTIWGHIPNLQIAETPGFLFIMFMSILFSTIGVHDSL